GGTRTSAITGGFIALNDALRRVVRSGLLERNPVKDYLAAVSVGIVNREPRLDLCYAEDCSAEVDMNIVMTGSGKIVEIQGTAESEPFSADDLGELLVLGRKGIQGLVALQREISEPDMVK
ncbi:MAG TPA: ribonuclease PH, partial [Dissulfurispiraceae bacterium]|nr:ribonuclease PH [Dissulfurispiraceae bacterium]